MKPIRLLIADDHALFREGVQALLAATDDVVVVGEAATGAEAIAQGRNNSQIAEALVISPKTVRNHVTSIYSKLQVADRPEAIIRAREAGFGKGNEQR